MAQPTTRRHHRSKTAATETITRFIDDLDGSAAHVIVTFAEDGVGYEIDLSTSNADTLRTPRTPSTPSIDLSRVRDWAIREGHTIAARGRSRTN